MRSAVIKGLDKIQKRLTTQDFIAKPTGVFLRDWGQTLKQEVLDRAPNWQGGIIDAVKYSQDTARFPLYARVFSDAPEARWMEYGTGLLSEDPKSNHSRYRPPAERVQQWAEDHGTDGGTISSVIFQRGGTPPTHFFSDAERAADARWNSQVSRFGRNIGREAERL